MSGKDKLRKFRENETFENLLQPTTAEVFQKDHPMKGNWGEKMFGNNNPIILELGCGKGEYTIALAEKFPQNNYIGVDIKGARLWKGAKYATEKSLKNVAFLRTRIEFIDSIFAQGEVSEIWLTFSDPQPNKPRKRLSSPLFLERYSHILKEDGIIHLKTDSQLLPLRPSRAKITFCSKPIMTFTEQTVLKMTTSSRSRPSTKSSFLPKEWL